MQLTRERGVGHDRDVALLGGSLRGGLAVLRIFDAAGREVPYLLVPPARREPEWRRGQVLPIIATRK